MATRIERLARPKPIHLKLPDRRSVYWLDVLPERRRDGPTVFELSPRWLALSDDRPCRAGYQDNRRPPAWEVSSAAMRAAASERVCSLAKPRPPTSAWQPGRPLLSKALIEWIDATVAKQTHPQYQLGRRVSWPVPVPARGGGASERVRQLARPKQHRALDQGYDPYTVSLAASRASASPRVLQLSVPLPRKCRQK
ncbi:LOW QUALITY PROTEIN: sperm microtubule associated protein 2 [Conger conger]|uniref:LOW QUALITY PROTEIN: sperm microtubule associated protein 2 n=1 Tax=Conger conger TaxID=82655 RepID=UPI002A5A34DB|nr:LOW QUALITY PROTEIN: sperm microtubule associated protein 2 [Conger conger]